MNLRFRPIILLVAALIALSGWTSSQAGSAQTPDMVVGFKQDGSSVNINPSQNSLTPALALGSPTGGAPQPWLASTEGGQGGTAAQVVVTTFNQAGGTWEQRGGALNSSPTNSAGSPSIAFAGTTLWAAFVETIGGKQQLLADRFTGTAWQPTGTIGAPSLNLDAGQNADSPAIGADSAANPPWLAWRESVAGRGTQVFVRRAVANAGALGGFAWQITGKNNGTLAKPTLNLDIQRSAGPPDLVFSGAAPGQAWVTWHEQGGGRAARVFVAQAVADVTGQGGVRWDAVGSQIGCSASNELACALNRNAVHAALDPKIASGALDGEVAPTPWVVYSEQDSSGISQIYVMRMDPGGSQFRPVGDSLNVAPGENATHPDIFFVGKVPHVAWTETQSGVKKIYVKHLADVRPGLERWDLNNGLTDISHSAEQADRPTLSSNGATPYVAWEEAGGPSKIFVAHRTPEDAAWGTNRPPFIRIISGTHFLNREAFDVAPAQALAAVDRLGPAEITSSCDHVDGWEHISEIQFQLADDTGPIFFGKYVAAEDKVYVEDPDHPGTFVGGAKPGVGASIDTKFISLLVPKMQTTNHGIGSPAFDIKWVIEFKRPTFMRGYNQLLNIVYDNNKSTGFVRTGRLFVGSQVFLPALRR